MARVGKWRVFTRCQLAPYPAVVALNFDAVPLLNRSKLNLIPGQLFSIAFSTILAAAGFAEAAIPPVVDGYESFAALS
jgi:hypothetical protein